MSEGALTTITARNLSEPVSSPRAVLVLGKTDCGHCANYEREILAQIEAGALEGVAIGKLMLDAPGSPRFKKQNPWIGQLDALPYTLIFESGKLVTHFAASRASYLIEKLESVAGAEA